MTVSTVRPRRGVALVWALVILVAISVFTIAITGDLVTARKSLDRRHHRMQAEHLAEAGLLLASGKLKADENYKGETLKIMTDGEVTIKVTRNGSKVSIHTEAKFPMTNRHPVAVKKTESIP